MARILPGFAGPGECYGTAMGRYRRLRLILLVLSAVPLTLASALEAAEKKSGAAASASPTSASQRLGAADGWTAYVYKEKSGQVCYLAGEIAHLPGLLLVYIGRPTVRSPEPLRRTRWRSRCG